MSNIFLPGVFKHGLLFLGSPEQREALGLTPGYLEAYAVDAAEVALLGERVGVAETLEGHPANMVEALAEGVRFSSLEHVLRTTVTRAAVLRPVVPPEDLLEGLAAALVQVGAPYDFKFDFEDPTYLCCTELVYRVFQGKGEIDLHFVRTRGLWVLNADDITRYALRDTEARAFAVVAYVEADPEDPGHRALLRFGADAQQRLSVLFEEPAASVAAASAQSGGGR
jgi:hypothetical protein